MSGGPTTVQSNLSFSSLERSIHAGEGHALNPANFMTIVNKHIQQGIPFDTDLQNPHFLNQTVSAILGGQAPREQIGLLSFCAAALTQLGPRDQFQAYVNAKTLCAVIHEISFKDDVLGNLGRAELTAVVQNLGRASEQLQQRADSEVLNPQNPARPVTPGVYYALCDQIGRDITRIEYSTRQGSTAKW